MLHYSLRTFDKLMKVKEKKRLEKEKIEKECIEEEIANTDTVFASTGSFSFDFFDPFLSKLFDIDLKALLADINTSNRIPIAFQSN